MNKVLFILSLVFVTSNAFAMAEGEKITGRVAIQGESGSTKFYVPLPLGEWEVTYTRERRGTGSAPKMRDAGLMLFEGGRLKSVIEMTAYIESRPMRWTDEPCKGTEATYFKNDFGSRLWEQKCLVAIPATFLQKTNEPTRKALEKLAQRNIVNEFNAIKLMYSRYDNKGMFVIYRQFIFPGYFGFENPKESVLNSWSWYPPVAEKDPAKKTFIDLVQQYGLSIAAAVDTGYEKKLLSPVVDLIYPPVPAGENQSETSVKDSSVEGRLLALRGLFEKNLISESEYQSKRQAILDELK